LQGTDLLSREARGVSRTWGDHHPLTTAQIQLGGSEAWVRNVSYYHGGDVLYELGGIDGYWHEAVLEPA